MSDEKPQLGGKEEVAKILDFATARCDVQLNSTTKYYEWDGLSMGNPSPYLVAQEVEKAGIIPIFIRKYEFKDIYDQYEKIFNKTGVKIGNLTDNVDGDTFVNFIKDAYFEATKKVIPNFSKFSENLKFEYSLRCPGGNVTQTYCDNIQKGDTVYLDISVTMNNCFVDEEIKIVIPAYDSAVLKVKSNCTCACETTTTTSTSKSDECSKQGTLSCGKCMCDSGKSGPICDCNQDEATIISKCTAKDGGEMCSDNGYCNCGTCVCDNKNITGTYCECNNIGCPTTGGVLCSGNGSCKCGICTCEEGWQGASCAEKDCNYLEKKCVDQNNELCNGFQCDCGQCKCGFGYTGSQCQKCVICKISCKSFEPIAFNSTFPLDKYNFNEKYNATYNNCEACNITTVSSKKNLKGTICTSVHKNCIYSYGYEADEEGNTNLYVTKLDRNSDCDKKVNPLVISGITVGIVLGAGIAAIVLFKLFLYFMDKREYEKFLKERKEYQFNEENPLYKDMEMHQVK